MSITTIINCYNEEEYIADAIYSVLTQTASDIITSIIIVDDGSTDNSRHILEDFKRRNKTISTVFQQNQGLAQARNAALALVETEWVCFLDGDDVWHSEKIERQVSVAQELPGCSFFYTDSIKFGAQQQRTHCRTLPLGNERIIDYFRNDAPIVPSSVLIRKSVFEQCGGFDPELRLAQDTEMWGRALSITPATHIKEPLLYRRVHEQSLGSNLSAKEVYLLKAVSKLIAFYPYLDKHKKKRISRIKSDIAIRYCISGNRLGAAKKAFQAALNDPLKTKNYILFFLQLSPAPAFSLRILGFLRRKLLRTSPE